MRNTQNLQAITYAIQHYFKMTKKILKEDVTTAWAVLHFKAKHNSFNYVH